MGREKISEKIVENHPAHYPQLREAPCAHPATSKGWKRKREGKRGILHINVSNILGEIERKQKRPGMSSSCLLHLEQTPFPWRGKRMDSNIPRNIGDIPSGNVSSGKQILTRSLCQGRASPGWGNLFLLWFHPSRAFPPRSSLPFAFPWDSMKEKNRDFE